MNMILDKTKEVAKTLLPVVMLVLLLCFTIVEVEADVIWRFIVGSIMLLIGLSFFLLGVDLAMNSIGEYMSKEVATSKTRSMIVVLSFLLGFLVTVAEPDLLILGGQVQAASGGTLSANVIVYMVSIGVGVMVSLGVFRLLGDVPINAFMAKAYGIIFVLMFFVSEEFLAISFDASGATTGALTTPFVLALSMGLSKVKGGKSSEENSFGLVGIMSVGPILAVMLMSIISGQKNIQDGVTEYIVAEGVFGPILSRLPEIFKESVIAILPICVLFFIFNYMKFKISKDELIKIITGLVLTTLGLIIFLTGVNSGFMDMGRIIGLDIATNHWMLIGIGFLLGFIVVLVEPAVHVLGEQIEEVTSGHIPLSLIRMTLSVGVALAVALSMVRIVVPSVKLWYFLLPGFAISIIMSFITEPIFVGIAYDAGGVASGPMTATFVLAFAQGAATTIDTANVLVDGFGIIAMVAMVPVLSIMILGTVFKHKRVEYPMADAKCSFISCQDDNEIQQDCIMAIVNRGFAEKVVEVARLSGAKGATIIHARGTGEHQKVVLPIINMELQPEKEVILVIVGTKISSYVADNLLTDSNLTADGEIAVYISPTDAMVKVA
jgi:nitrogen regulatory protein PII